MTKNRKSINVEKSKYEHIAGRIILQLSNIQQLK